MHTKLNLRHVWKHYATRNKRKSMGETRGKDLEVNEWCWKMFSSNVWVWVWMWMWEHTFYWKCTFHQPSKCSALKMANRNCTLLSNIPCIWQTEIQNEMRWKLQHSSTYHRCYSDSNDDHNVDDKNTFCHLFHLIYIKNGSLCKIAQNDLKLKFKLPCNFQCENPYIFDIGQFCGVSKQHCFIYSNTKCNLIESQR